MIKTLILEKLLLIRSHFSKSSIIPIIASMVLMFGTMFKDINEAAVFAKYIFPIFLIITSVMLCSISDMHESKSKFGKYLLASPACISDISAAKYLFSFLVQTSSAIISALMIIVSALVSGTAVTISLFTPTLTLCGFSMTFYSIYNFISLKHGDETANNATGLILLGLLLLAFIYALFGDLEIIAKIYDSLVSSSEKLPIYAAVYAAVSMIFMLIGYALSKKINYIY